MRSAAWYRTPLRGRDELLESLLTQLTASPGLITLWGPGGVGKTRLGVELLGAWMRRRRDRDGTWLCSLQDHPDADDLAGHLTGALEIPGTWLPHREALQRVGRWIARAQVPVLLLDDAEGSLPAVREVVEALRAAAPALRVLVTTREPLGAPGEVVVSVDPLEFEAARQLFLDRAPLQSVPEDAELRAVLEPLHGLALAIELAASRLEVLTLSALKSRLRDPLTLLRNPEGTGRHATVRASVQASLDALTEDSRGALGRLLVFSHDAPLDGVEAVVGPGPEGAPALDQVQLLVRRSLLRPVEGADPQVPRFRLAPFVRELLFAQDDPEILLRHGRFYAELALAEVRSDARSVRLMAEEAELRTAAGRLLPPPLRAACALGLVQATLGRRPVSSRLAALDAILTAIDAPMQGTPDPAFPLGLCTELHRARCTLLLRLGRLDESTEAARRGLAVAEAEHDPSRAAVLLGLLADRRCRQGDNVEGGRLFARSFEIALQAGLRHEAAPSLVALTLTEDLVLSYTPERAKERLLQALELGRGGPPGVTANVRSRLGQVLLALGQLEQALLIQTESLAEAVASRLPFQLAHAHLGVGDVQFALGDLASAEHNLRQSILASEESELRDVAAGAEAVLGLLYLERDDPVTACALAHSARARLQDGPLDWDIYELAASSLLAVALELRGDREGADAAELRVREGVARELSEAAYLGCAAMTSALRSLAATVREACAGGRVPTQAQRLASRQAIDAVDAQYVSFLLLARRVAAAMEARLDRFARTWTVVRDGSWFAPPEGTPVDLSRHKAAARILARLAEAWTEGSGPVDPDTLVTVGWPGEQLLPKAGRNRLHVTLSILRSNGFEPLTRDRDGYALSPTMLLRVVESGAVDRLAP